MSWIAFSTPGHGSAFNGTSLEAEPLPVLCFCLEGWDTFFFVLILLTSCVREFLGFCSGKWG